jgi:radical SAM enzyme (TIGR01210 family)
VTTTPANEERPRSLAHRSALDFTRPQHFFMEHERAGSGDILPTAIVFLTNRECPWRCIYCDLWKKTTVATVPAGAIPAQIDFALERLGMDVSDKSVPAHDNRRGPRFSQPGQIKLYNSGSFFDPKAIPPHDFEAIARRVRGFSRVIVESHPALVGDSALQFRNALAHSASRTPHAALEVAMGLEAADDALLARLNKRMTLALFRRAAEFLIGNGIAVRAFVIVKPPFVRTGAAALELACRSIDFAFDCGASVVSLIPARFGPAELADLARAGEFSPPPLETVEDALDYGVAQGRGRVFVDLWDIGEVESCARSQPHRIARLREMNLAQVVLPHIPCAPEAAGNPIT